MRLRWSAVAGLALALSACTARPVPHVPASTPAPASTLPSSPTPVVVPSAIPPDPGTVVLAQVSAPGVSSYTTPALSVHAGDLEITSDCTGGEVVVTVESIATFPIPCALDAVTPTRNVVALPKSTTVTIHVEAPVGARWNLLVDLRPPTASPTGRP